MKPGRHVPARSDATIADAPRRAARLLCVALGLTAGPALAQPSPPPVFEVVGGALQKRANAVLALMGFSVVPDLTSSFLSISDAQAANPSLSMSQLAGGFTLGRETPLYLEGGIAVGRYDPKFIVSGGGETRELPLKWTNVVGTLGVGWDVPLTDTLKLRPIGNFALGHMSSDASLLGLLLEYRTDATLAFLERGRLNAYGLGASLMLDYEDYTPRREIDVEIRYSMMRLQSYGSTSAAVVGRSNVDTLSAYARWRAPTGLQLLDRPLRYVLESALSVFYGDQRDVLGFTRLGSVGAGIELDTSAKTGLFSRVRLVGRYAFGDGGVKGGALGLALSF